MARNTKYDELLNQYIKNYLKLKPLTDKLPNASITEIVAFQSQQIQILHEQIEIVMRILSESNKPDYDEPGRLRIQ